MFRKTVSALMLVLLVVSIFAVVFKTQPASADVDWWPMFHHDLMHNGCSTSAAPKTNQTRWIFNTGFGCWVSSSPAVADGVVYVGSCTNYQVWALDAATGGLVWSYQTGGSIEESSPAVAGGVVYVGSDDHLVYALDAATGALVWSYATGDRVISSPAVADGVVYVGSVDNHVYAFGPSSNQSSTYVVCSPNPVAVGSPVTCAATVFGSNPTGTVTWSTNSSTGNFNPAVSSLSSGSCTTTYMDTSSDKVNITASYSGDLSNAPSSGSTTLAVVQTHTVNFAESGLPPETTWTVTLKGYQNTKPSGSKITFSQTNGHYPFSVTSSSGYYPSPTSQGTINVEGDTNIDITWSIIQCDPVAIKEIGLPQATSWSITYESITQTSVSNSIAWNFTGGTPHFSAGSSGYTAEPSSFYVPATTNTDVIFVPNSNYCQFVSWDPLNDSYSILNPSLSWAPNGICYGLTTTATLYFMQNRENMLGYPFFPLQNPRAKSTSDLDLGNNPSSILTNAGLAVYLHQIWDPNSTINENFPAFQKNFGELKSSLHSGCPVLLDLWSTQWINRPNPHEVAAWGVGILANGTYAIAVYDPNRPQSTQVAIYDATSGDFSYDVYNDFAVVIPQTLKMSWFNVAPGSYKTFDKFLGYTLVVANKMATVSLDDGSTDKFTESGDSTTFVCGIQGSSGIEDGEVQAYAIPKSLGNPHVDPANNQSTIFISRMDNESGQLVEYAYILNATTTQGSLNYTVTPLDSGLSIIAGDNALNASAAFSSTTQQGYSVSDVMTAKIDAGQSVNLTAPCLASFTTTKTVVGQGYPVPIDVTITNVGDNPQDANLTLNANSTTLDSETVFNMLNGTSINLVCSGNTSNCAYGNYTLSAYCQPNEINEAANNFTYTGSITVTIPGDVNGDFTVDIYDAIILAGAFNTNPISSHWNANADNNGDNVVDIYDAIILAGHFNQHP